MWKPSPSSKMACRAFSLVELVFVLATIALLAGVAMPRFGRATARYQVDAAGKRVMADLLNAQQRARAASAPCTVTFIRGTSNYTITYPTIGGVAGATVSVDLALPPFRAAINNVNFTGSTAVSFDGYGVPSSSGFVTLVSGGETRRISVTSGGLIRS